LKQNSVLQTDNRTSYYTQQSSYNDSKQQNIPYTYNAMVRT